ncbi:hypothetical protein HYP71_gp042 [Arthrobacter phage KBurrousTX]|uniref:Uncharacterized protein n=1 Tax=Arthrobacter phage KBurrousTX TaxID=2315608 RepID=A0A386KBA4_9CAUD|nr:hypothetical protein HYP71_gp042 [Arthrobacter phage KBurrousTX]AYD81536.1 hypothetical protein KBurrousTX_42 [Arthrobacter phage KBurrousTX]
MITAQLLGGPCDGRTIQLADDMQAFHVPCTVITDNPDMQGEFVGPGFPCVATYAFFQTLPSGTKVFRLSGIHSNA